jgi:hypothetical protein
VVEQAVAQTEWSQQEVLHRRVVRGAGDDFDQPSQEGEGGVVVGEVLTEREDLWQLWQPLADVAGNRPIIIAGIKPLIAVEPGRVVQKVGDCHLGRNCLVHKRQLGNVGADRGVELQRPCVDEMPDHCAGERLGEGADLEERLRGHGTQ